MAATKRKRTTNKPSFRLDPKGAALIVFAIMFAAVGSYFVFFSKAATPLTWAPPSGYTSYPVKNVSVSTSTQTISGSGGDIWVKLPSSPSGPINLTNCRNVVIMGGQITIPPNTGPGDDIRGIYINGCTGTVHIEGVYIDGSTPTAEADGIAIKAPQAIVQIENVRVNKLYGGQDTAIHNHSDIIQPWGGVKELRVDRLSGTSNFQGFQINDDQGHIGKVTIKNTNIGDSGVAPPTSNGGYYLWVKCGTGTTYSFSNFYVQPRSGRNLGNSLWDGGCGLNPGSTSATYSNSAVTGSILNGKPATGDFVPAGSVGIGYTSTGYAVDSGTTTPTTPPPTTPTTPTTSTVKTVVSENFDQKVNLDQVYGAWSIVGGRAENSSVKNASSGNGNIAVSPTAVAGDFTLNVNGLVKATSEQYDDFSVIFDYVDANNYYYASFNETNDGGTNGIFRIKNGTMTQLKDFSPVIKAGTDYKITVKKSGSTITVSSNDVVIGSVADTAFTSGKVGIGSRNNAVSFDNLVVTQ